MCYSFRCELGITRKWEEIVDVLSIPTTHTQYAIHLGKYANIDMLYILRYEL